MTSLCQQRSDALVISCQAQAMSSVLRSCANTGVVTLGASQTTGTYLLPRLIAVFRQRNPQVVVQLRVSASQCFSASNPLLRRRRQRHGPLRVRSRADCVPVLSVGCVVRLK